MKVKTLIHVLALGAVFGTTAAHAERLDGEVPLKPYVFGTVGAAQEGFKTSNGAFNDRDVAATGQVGVGIQLSEYVGGEMYFEGGDKFRYENNAGRKVKMKSHSIGTRAVIGTSTENRARVFAKVGVAAVTHEMGEREVARPQFTAGVGASFNVSDNFAVRGDYDHKFKRNSDLDRKGSDYVGVGGQVNF